MKHCQLKSAPSRHSVPSSQTAHAGSHRDDKTLAFVHQIRGHTPVGSVRSQTNGFSQHENGHSHSEQPCTRWWHPLPQRQAGPWLRAEARAATGAGGNQRGGRAAGAPPKRENEVMREKAREGGVEARGSSVQSWRSSLAVARPASGCGGARGVSVGGGALACSSSCSYSYSSSSWGGHSRGDHYDRSRRKASSAAGSLITAMSGSVRICRPSMSMGSRPARSASSAENRSAESKEPRDDWPSSLACCCSAPLSRAASSVPGPALGRRHQDCCEGPHPVRMMSGMLVGVWGVWGAPPLEGLAAVFAEYCSSPV